MSANRKKGFYTKCDPNKQEVDSFLYEAAQNCEVISDIQNWKLKSKNL
jgi:hypothetical protein